MEVFFILKINCFLLCFSCVRDIIDLYNRIEINFFKYLLLKKFITKSHILKTLDIITEWRKIMPYDLYFMPTGNNIRVILLLEALGIQYKKHLHNPFIGDKLDFTLNPTGKVPALLDTEHDIAIFESANILLYLCDKHDTEGQFLPLQPIERAQYLSWLFKIIGEFQTTKQLFISSTTAAKTPKDKALFVTRASKVLHQHLKAFNHQMSVNKNGHLLGDDYNIIDIALLSVLFDFDKDLYPKMGANDHIGMQLYLANKWLVLETADLTKYPLLKVFIDKMKNNPTIVDIIKSDYSMWEK